MAVKQRAVNNCIRGRAAEGAGRRASHSRQQPGEKGQNDLGAAGGLRRSPATGDGTKGGQERPASRNERGMMPRCCANQKGGGIERGVANPFSGGGIPDSFNSRSIRSPPTSRAVNGQHRQRCNLQLSNQRWEGAFAKNEARNGGVVTPWATLVP